MGPSKYKVVVEVSTALLTQVLEAVENKGGEVIDVVKLAVNGNADAPLNDGPPLTWGRSNLVALDESPDDFVSRGSSRMVLFKRDKAERDEKPVRFTEADIGLTAAELKAKRRERRLAYKRAYNKRVRAEQRRAGSRVR